MHLPKDKPTAQNKFFETDKVAENICGTLCITRVTAWGLFLTTLYQLDPCQDERWVSFLAKHPSASVFHTPEWLESLRRTYGYEPVAYSTCAPGTQLANGFVFCRVNSWLTGKRLVSLPFSDHVNPLLEAGQTLEDVLPLLSLKEGTNYRYMEIRPNMEWTGTQHFRPSNQFVWHRLSLDPELDELLGKFHKSCVQRNIRRAERERLEYESGNSERLLQHFYRLLSMSHRRHHVPPQPISWFRNIMQALGKMANIRVAFRHDQAVAALLTLSYKQNVVYKYGGSDERYHHLGGMPFLFWQTIQEAKKDGFAELDLGRCECDNIGLIKFKEHWGARRSRLEYWRYSTKKISGISRVEMRTAKRIFSFVPSAALPMAGRLLYRHIG